MSKVRKNYVCQACGSVHTKWSGKCEGCGEWNSITEELNESVSPLTAKRKKGSVIEFQPLKGESLDARNRLTSSVQEFDRVCGGGLVKGSITLIGGDPGIGKSTLLLQIVCHLAAKDVRCAYISGEEAVDQVRLRAKRLGLENTPVHLAASSNMFNILETLEATHGANPFDVVVIDSGSTDDTVTIAESHGARVVPFAWNGQYPKKRQWCLDHLELAHDWVFFVDADEIVTPALADEIRRVVAAPAHQGYFIEGQYVIDGKVLRFGLKNSKIVLFDRRQFSFPVISDLYISGMGEMEGHYQPLPDNGVKSRPVPGKFFHAA